MQINYKTFLVLILTGLLVSACGFHLRGKTPLPPAMHALYLETDNPYGQFESTLRQTLTSAGITLTEAPKDASVVMKISKPVLSNSLSTLGTSNQTRVYTVVYTVAFSLISPQGKVLLPVTSVSATRSLTLSANQLLDSNSQLTILEQEMQRDVIAQLYNRLSSQQVFQTLQSQ